MTLLHEALPSAATLVAVVPGDLADDDAELAARIRISVAGYHAATTSDELETAIAILQARAIGDEAEDPFGPRVRADSYAGLADAAERAVADDALDLETVLAILFESGAVAALQGRRLIRFLGLTAAIRRATWDLAAAELERRAAPPDTYVELGRLLFLASELSSLAIGEGYRATERELLDRDAAARRAALDELLGSTSTEPRTTARLRRLAMRYGVDPDATYRLAAVLPGPELDPTPATPGIDEEDLELMARRVDHMLRRPVGRTEGPGVGIRVPLAITWRGAIVAILGQDPREWSRLREALDTVLGTDPAHWIAIAAQAEGIGSLAHGLIELQEGLRVAASLGRRGVIDDLAEVGIERMLLGDPALVKSVIDRELGPLLADPRMGEELVETLQVFFDAGENRRETARRLHLADRTVAYRLERAEQLLGHGFEGEAGRRLNVALTLRRLAAP